MKLRFAILPADIHARGSAVLIILVLIGAIALIVLANCTTLHWMKREILRIEERQRRVRTSLPVPAAVPALNPKAAQVPRPPPSPVLTADISRR